MLFGAKTSVATGSKTPAQACRATGYGVLSDYIVETLRELKALRKELASRPMEPGTRIRPSRRISRGQPPGVTVRQLFVNYAAAHADRASGRSAREKARRAKEPQK